LASRKDGLQAFMTIHLRSEENDFYVNRFLEILTLAKVKPPPKLQPVQYLKHM